MDYFLGLKNEDEIKKRFRALAVENHPDKGGDVSVMQEINRQKVLALKNISSPFFSSSANFKSHNRESSLSDEQIWELIRFSMDVLLKMFNKE